MDAQTITLNDKARATLVGMAKDGAHPMAIIARVWWFILGHPLEEHGEQIKPGQYKLVDAAKVLQDIVEALREDERSSLLLNWCNVGPSKAEGE